ncbi:tyrosine recombinase XerD [Mucilaginibacter mali]|uniref:Tyrosine recombinase XerC n=1 Tax=Mucilaginibacter mali TaxID=2740462 RepID=A0A7D4TUJ3_9SPHI|nr:site-specific tyrosine recombinase [Mucilaginibacter mali]QKJ29815.1 tyrosine recombinase XerD [Mucilaginibacter mali]
MDWQPAIKGFRSYLKLERSLAENSILAYERDIEKLYQFSDIQSPRIKPETVTLTDLRNFMVWLGELGMIPTTQARIVSGVKTFYKYLLMHDVIDINPSELLEAPKTRRKLPAVLTIADIDMLIAAIDLSKPEGPRNKAILEVLFSCGLRVSELTNLKISNLFLNIDFIKVTGKGSKERLIPIGSEAKKALTIWLDEVRVHTHPKKGEDDYVFLNRRGAHLTREMVFIIIRQLVVATGLKKAISPHTFRHSFATYLIEGGADLRAVQEMLGHESITTTEIYTHLDREFLRSTIIEFHPRS